MEKVKGVHNTLKIVFLMMVLFSCNKVLALENENEFQMNFIKTVTYPEQLKYSCTPAFTNLLIDISEKGVVQNLRISDSAPKSLKDAFDLVKNKLKIQLVDNIIIKRKLKNCGIIIPVFYVYGQDYCTNSFSDFLSMRYLTFDSKMYDKMTVTLAPIIVSFYKPVY
ncbi:hypothetical protein BH09BAC6_BH09BAC6_29130 [soil metagenome]